MKLPSFLLSLPFNSRLRSRARIWSVPLAYILAATLLGHIIPQINFIIFPRLFLIDAGTASALLSTISSGMIAFTGFVFSMVFVLIQFGSTTYTPRLAGYLLQDPVVRHALGIFTGTFLFTLNAASYVNVRASEIVPNLAVIFALLLVTASSVMFLALIERVTSLRVSSVLHMVGSRGRQVIERMYTRRFAAGESEDLTDHQSMLEQVPLPLPPITQSLVHSGEPGIIMQYHMDQLLILAQRAQGLIEIRYPPGDTLPDGAVILNLRGARRTIRPAFLRAAVEMGHERTIEQDPKYALRLIVDIAIRALSPAINDPTTAVQALDELDDLLHRLGTRHLDVGILRNRQGVIRVLYPTPDWEDFLSLAIDEIRQYGAGSIQVMRRLQALLQDLLDVLPAERAAPVERYLQRVKNSIQHHFVDFQDRLSAQQADRQGMGLSRPIEALDDQTPPAS